MKPGKEKKMMKNVLKRIGVLLFAIGGMIFLSGCMGFYKNSDNFLNIPQTGAQEIVILNELGIPTYSTSVEEKKVYCYRVRDVKYIILVGIYEGYDLIITCRDGVVVESKRVPRPRTFTLFSPVPWAVTD